MEEQNQIAIEILLKNSTVDTIYDALEEWDFDCFKQEDGQCVCGKHIQSIYVIKNAINDTTLCFGQCCLEAIGCELLTDSGCIARKEIKESNRRLCGSCLKLRIGKSEPSYKIQCRTCKENGDEINQAYKNFYFRHCRACGSNAILPFAPEWKKDCDECYAIKKDSMRECEICGLKRINPSESQNTKVCFPCKKERGTRQCPGCGEFNIFVLEKWRKVCIDCWKKENKK